MRVKQIIIGKAADLATTLGSPSDFAADLLLVFGGIEHFTLPGLSELLRCTFPDAMVLGCSTAGEITADGVNDGTCTITATVKSAINTAVTRWLSQSRRP